MASPLVGYNTNVRHHGKVFHIQTEDSGLTHGHIFTHLFADGGRIVATRKTTYAEHVGTDRYPGIVKRLMQAQHKAMFIALRDGLFDENEVEGAKLFAAREIVLEEADGRTSTVPAVTPSSPGSVTAPEGASLEPSPPAPTPTPAAPIAAPTASSSASTMAFERAAASFASASPMEPTSSDILVDTQATIPGSLVSPIPPASALSRGGSPPSRTFSKPAPHAPARSEPVPAPPPKSLYGTTQAAVKRSNAKPREQSLFGQDLLSEKSLDEVIMSYLADDVDKE